MANEVANGVQRHDLGKKLMMGLDKNPVNTWNREEFDADSREKEDLELKNFKVLSSFNWDKERAVPLMRVPGVAPMFIEWEGGQLEADTEEFPLNDQNRERMPMHPLEASLRAVDVYSDIQKKGKPSFEDFDIVTTRKNLGALFVFFDRSGPDRPYRGKPLPFRIDVERVGRLIFLIRHDVDSETMKNYTGASSRNNVYYGLDFEKKCTDPGCFGGMYREIASYQLGGLKLLVNYEVDCIRSDNSEDKDQTNSNYIPDQKTENGSVDELTDSFAAKASLSPSQPKPFSTESPLQYVRAGHRPKLPYRRVELTTRFKAAPFRGEIFSKMFFSDTHLLALGRHEGGLCEKPELLSLDQVMETFGGFPKESMDKMTQFLAALVRFIRLRPESEKFGLVWFPYESRGGAGRGRGRGRGSYQSGNGYPPLSPQIKLYRKDNSPVTPGGDVTEALPERYKDELLERVGQLDVSTSASTKEKYEDFEVITNDLESVFR